MTFSYNFDDDILEHQRLVDADNELELKRLLQKYGSLEGIKKNADVRDSMAYMMANQNGLAQKVLTQETGNSLLSSYGTQYAKNDRANYASDANLPVLVKIGATVDYAKYGEGFSKEFIDEMLNDERFQKILNERTKANEGGYVNHPHDRGGPTKYGISTRWYPNEDIKNLTRERANAIFYRDYWIKTKIYQLPDEFAGIVFDDGIVQGPPTAIRNIQKALGVKDDGKIGPNTLRALKNTNYKILRKKFIENIHHIEDMYQKGDPSQKVFEKGHRARYNRYYNDY